MHARVHSHTYAWTVRITRIFLCVTKQFVLQTSSGPCILRWSRRSRRHQIVSYRMHGNLYSHRTCLWAVTYGTRVSRPACARTCTCSHGAARTLRHVLRDTYLQLASCVNLKTFRMYYTCICRWLHVVYVITTFCALALRFCNLLGYVYVHITRIGTCSFRFPVTYYYCSYLFPFSPLWEA